MRIAQRWFVVAMVAGSFGLAVGSIEAQPDAKKVVPQKTPAKPAAKDQKPAVKGTPAPAANSTADPAAEAAIRKLAEAFAVAYNAGDAKAIAAGYAADGEFVDEDGQVIRGREAIERHFTVVFRELPKARMKILVDSVRLIAPNIAVEEGRVEARPTPEVAAEISHYVALHVRQGDQWLLARTRDFPAEAASPSGHEHLLPLEWLVGEWVDESPDARIHTNCKWAEGKNFLIQEFTARVGTRTGMNGSTRIGWDPLARQIKSWTFESEGGYSEGLWTQVDGDWVIKSRGVTREGRVTSATIRIKKIDKSTMSWESKDRIIGGEVQSNVGPILVKSRPPAPAQ